MNFLNIKTASVCFACVFSLLVPRAEGVPNPNFHIYIAYGQSNMAGAGPIQTGDQDTVGNFVMMSGIDCSSRKGGTSIRLAKGQWALAVPPHVSLSGRPFRRRLLWQNHGAGNARRDLLNLGVPYGMRK